LLKQKWKRLGLCMKCGGSKVWDGDGSHPHGAYWTNYKCTKCGDIKSISHLKYGIIYILGAQTLLWIIKNIPLIILIVNCYFITYTIKDFCCFIQVIIFTVCVWNIVV